MAIETFPVEILHIDYSNLDFFRNSSEIWNIDKKTKNYPIRTCAVLKITIFAPIMQSL